MPACLKVDEAGRDGAELILLPEDGIHGYGFTRYKVEQKINMDNKLFCRETPALKDCSSTGLVSQAKDPWFEFWIFTKINIFNDFSQISTCKIFIFSYLGS